MVKEGRKRGNKSCKRGSEVVKEEWKRKEAGAGWGGYKVKEDRGVLEEEGWL